MAYSFFMDKVQLPVTPAKLQTKIKNQNKTISLVDENEVNILKSAGLTEISFDAKIPQVRYSFSVYPDGFRPANYYLSVFERLKTGKAPFQFICSRVSPGGELLFDTDMKVSLEEYSVTEDASDGLDLTVSIKLRQYRSYGTKTVKIVTAEATPKAKASESRPSQSAPVTKTYTVVKGDCLWNIAKKHLGDGARYKEIWALNKDKIINPNLIYPGQVLVMP